MDRAGRINSLGDIVKARRRELGWTQEELAARVVALGDEAFRQSDVSRLEQGRIGLPHRDRLHRLAAALQVSPGELLARSGWSGAASAFDGRGATFEPMPVAPMVSADGQGSRRQSPAGSAGLVLLSAGDGAGGGPGVGDGHDEAIGRPLHGRRRGRRRMAKERTISMSSDGRAPHILVINDTQEILDLLQALLEDEGYRVTTSMALLDLDKVRRLEPDAIIQDLLFEGMQEQGWKFLTLARLDPDLAEVPLILCTAAVRTVCEPEMAAHLQRLGVRVVLKPFNIEDLLQPLAAVLAARANVLADGAADGWER